MKKLADIVPKHFLAWLKRQDDSRQFDYTEPNACLLSSFFSEELGEEVTAQPSYVYVGEHSQAMQDILYFKDSFWSAVDKILCNTDDAFFTIGEVRVKILEIPVA